MKATQVTRGFSRLALVAAAVLSLLASLQAAIGGWRITRTYLMTPEVEVLVPGGRMISLPYGLTEAEHTDLLKPYFSANAPAPLPSSHDRINRFAEFANVTLESAVRDAQRPAQLAAGERNEGLERLFDGLLFVGAGLAAYLAIRVLGWVLAGFFVD